MLELAKFKQVFGSNMGSYQRKKYVCKLLYIFMLGYRVELGRREAILLCGAKKFAEKQVVSIKKEFKYYFIDCSFLGILSCWCFTS